MTFRASGEWGAFWRLLKFARPYIPRLGAGIACGLVYAVSNAGMVWVIKGGIREVFDPQRAGLWALLLMALLFPAVGIVRGAADFLATYCIRWAGHRVVMDLRNKMLGHLHALSVSYFSQSRTGEMISRVTNDTTLIERSVSTVIADLAKQPVTLLAMAAWVVVVDSRLALISFVVFPICLIPIAAFGRRVRRYSRQAQERIADVVSILQESISGIRIVKAFGMEGYETRRFADQAKALFDRIMRVEKADAMLEPIIVFIATAGVGMLLVYVRAVEMSVDDFFAFAAALFMMYEPVKKLGKIHVHIQQSSAAADRIFEVLDTESPIKERPNAVDFSGEIEEIRFDGISFSYGHETVLKNVSLCARAGERVAIVGGSGAGKTTLVNLLPRFYDVDLGSITMNGIDIRDMTLSSLRGRIGLVTQDTFLFNDTIANNIGYGAAGMGLDAVREAARRAYADGFIVELPSGYETVIGERGVRLSGGQRQRLAIARAILRNPPVLILDEATSALDTESERMVQAAIDELMRGRTVFAIAHRLSTISNCDKIIVLDGGGVAEQGTHEELLAVGGLYRRLYDLQFENSRDHKIHEPDHCLSDAKKF